MAKHLPNRATNGGSSDWERRARDGEIAALEEFDRRFGGQVRGYLWRLLGNEHDAADATQEVLLKAFQGMRTFRPNHASVETWVMRVAKNHALDVIKKRSRLVSKDPLAMQKQIEFEQRVETPLNRSDWLLDNELGVQVDALPHRRREVLFLRYACGLTPSEIAMKLNMSPDAVRQENHRALKTLRAAMPQTRSLL